jgi:erythromycin esterase-like protein/predicted phosphoribosyltransferase
MAIENERFRDRRAAGRLLGEWLGRFARENAIVLALPRGGVPVGYEVARALHAPLDVFLVRKLPAPGREDLALGAVTTGGARITHPDVIRALEVPSHVFDEVAERELAELRRLEIDCHGGRAAPHLAERTVVLVDDGLVTGATMRAAVEAVRQRAPRRIVVAVPVAPRDVLTDLSDRADEVVCLREVDPFRALGLWYESFPPVEPEEVRHLLGRAATRLEGRRPRHVPREERDVVEAVRAAARPLAGVEGDWDPLLDAIGDDTRYVLLGEATHGTHEFYAARAALTRRLVEAHGFSAVVVEADWPDASRVHRYVRGAGDDPDAEAALSGFRRFPTWMWRNVDVLALVEWMRRVPGVGFYGMDLYSLYASIGAVVDYLDRVDPEAARRARARYACFEHFYGDPQLYGRATRFDLSASCEAEVVEQLREMTRRAAERARGHAADEVFFAEQNARLVADAETYYRTMFRGYAESWNVRDAHMTDTIDALVAHLDRATGRRTRVVVWAHNSHLGDARATEMGEGGEQNVGQLLRDRHGREVFAVGFTTYAGTVTAADDWGEDPRHKRVRPALAASQEALLHDAGAGRDFLLVLRGGGEASGLLGRERRLERAIGVVYRPETERHSHYFAADLPGQFDAVVHFDTTRAVVPLDRHQTWQADRAETWPSGL